MATANVGLVNPVTVNTNDATFVKPELIVSMRADVITVHPRSTA